MPGKKQDGKYSLDLATKSLDFYADFFNFPMPLKKVDLIGVPDFSMGAMVRCFLYMLDFDGRICRRTGVS